MNHPWYSRPGGGLESKDKWVVRGLLKRQVEQAWLSHGLDVVAEEESGI